MGTLLAKGPLREAHVNRGKYQFIFLSVRFSPSFCRSSTIDGVLFIYRIIVRVPSTNHTYGRPNVRPNITGVIYYTRTYGSYVREMAPTVSRHDVHATFGESGLNSGKII